MWVHRDYAPEADYADRCGVGHVALVLAHSALVSSGCATAGQRMSTCPVPANDVADDMIGHLAEVGIQVEDGVSDRRAGLARFFRTPVPSGVVDGSVVVLNHANAWPATDDMVLLVSAPDANPT